MHFHCTIYYLQFLKAFFSFTMLLFFAAVGGDDSCQARTIQSCLVPIAEEVKDPKSFCIRLFSAMILTRSQLDRLTSLPVQMNKDKTSQNCDILLEVHRNVSNNFMLFEPFCNVLQTMNYQSCYDLLKGLFLLLLFTWLLLLLLLLF